MCPFCEKECESEQYLNTHIEKYCKEKNNCCFKCFRNGHLSSKCFAKTNKFGDQI